MQNTFEPIANTIPDACRRLGIGRSMLYERIAAGEIRAIKVGARTLIPESELRQFVARQLEQATAA